MSVANLVEKLIADNLCVVNSSFQQLNYQVFSKSYCPFCIKAKKLLDSIAPGYKAIELDEDSNGSEIQSYLAQKTGQRTVPNIFIRQQHIGGCDDLHSKHSQGKIVSLLK